MDLLEQYYTTVLWQEFSPDKEHLIASTKDGRVALFKISEILEEYQDETKTLKEPSGPFWAFQAHKSPIYAITSNAHFVISGGRGEIRGWNWDLILEKQAKGAQWSLQIPQDESLFMPEVNALKLSFESSTVFAGCGDKKVYAFDLQSNKPKVTLRGHSDFINCLSLSTCSNTLYSGSEDGSIRVWDLRTKEAVHVIEPHKQQDLNRPAFGKWIGCIDISPSGEWMVTGGGPLLSKWHLRSLSKAIEFETPPTESTANVVLFRNEVVISGGSNPYIYVWELDGTLRSQIPSSASNIYSLALRETEDNRSLLTSGGTSFKIDVCTNLKYRDFSIVVK